MNKKYQVFVSSTFVDLIEERDIAVKTLMAADCIPAGMELFPAVDIEQFEYIKRVIDECDYYLLIIGGKYGTLSEEGISYTEKEYDYAISQGKKVMAFLHKSPEELPRKKTEVSESAVEKLENFRTKASTARLVEFWENKHELEGKIALTIPKTIKMFPAVGWVRADELPSNSLMTELHEVKNENLELKDKIKGLTANRLSNKEDLSPLSDSVVIHGTYPVYTSHSSIVPASNKSFSISIQIGDIFRSLAPKIEDSHNEKACLELIEAFIKKSIEQENSEDTRRGLLSPNYDKEIILRFKYHLISLGLMTSYKAKSVGGDYFTYWSLTEDGLNELRKQLSFKPSETTK